MQQREFAERLEVTAGTYAQWEASNSRPRNVVAMAKRIELLTGVAATWILGLEAERPQPVGPAGAMARPEGFEPPTF
jgi:transcriptional regulator with XRE-family HTH domain